MYKTALFAVSQTFHDVVDSDVIPVEHFIDVRYYVHLGTQRLILIDGFIIWVVVIIPSAWNRLYETPILWTCVRLFVAPSDAQHR